MGLYLGGLIIGRILASVIRGTYFREGFFFLGGGGLLSEFYGISTVFKSHSQMHHMLAVFIAERNA